jgi:hypothetical protein
MLFKNGLLLEREEHSTNIDHAHSPDKSEHVSVGSGEGNGGGAGGGPSVLRRDLQCQPVRKVNAREAVSLSAAWPAFNPSNGNTPWSNFILECIIMFENEHRTFW